MEEGGPAAAEEAAYQTGLNTRSTRSNVWRDFQDGTQTQILCQVPFALQTLTVGSLTSPFFFYLQTLSPIFYFNIVFDCMRREKVTRQLNQPTSRASIVSQIKAS